MAFKRAEIKFNPTQRSISTGIKIGLRCPLKTKEAYATISIEKPTAEKLGLTKEPNAPVEVLLGTGEDKGKIAIVRNTENPNSFVRHVGTSHKGYYVIALGHQETFPNRKETAQPCEWKEEDGMILINLPAWAENKPETELIRKNSPQGESARKKMLSQIGQVKAT